MENDPSVGVTRIVDSKAGMKGNCTSNHAEEMARFTSSNPEAVAITTKSNPEVAATSSSSKLEVTTSTSSVEIFNAAVERGGKPPIFPTKVGTCSG